MYPLADLFNLSLSTCCIPPIWKCARVTPVFKGGDPSDVNNYRPISIICITAKIFEKLIFNQLSCYINNFNILSPLQSGFRPNFSTTSTLLKFTNDLFSAFDSGQTVGAIFIDLTKAFDLVDHYLLLDKLHHIGLDQNALCWFNAYLHCRRQYVTFNGSQSTSALVNSGVPQGSILGPLLFSIFINDLPQTCSNCHTHLYADDTVLYFANSDISKIQNSLQSDFNLIQNWFTNNKLFLNKKKTCSMIFGSKHSLSRSPSLCINFNDGSPLERVDVFKYLGLWIDPELSFKPHIDYICKKAYSCLGMLYRSINCFSFQVRKRLISQLIFPILDYVDIVYQNTSEKILKPLNTLHNSLCRFVLRCPFRTHHCFMFESLNWLQPKSKQQFHWLQFIFKCVHFDFPPYLKQLLIPYTSPYPLRHMNYPFFTIPRIHKELGRRSFSHKAPSDWNNLPPSLKSITSFPSFRSNLLSYLETRCSCF